MNATLILVLAWALIVSRITGAVFQQLTGLLGQ